MTITVVRLSGFKTGFLGPRCNCNRDKRAYRGRSRHLRFSNAAMQWGRAEGAPPQP
jgi:hypothetical protein